MYQPFEYDNDWGKVWKELMREDVKRWTLRDVGELLDKAVAKDLIKEGEDYDFLWDQS